MQHKPFFKLFLTVFIITLFFAHCKKGDVGPAGPAGPAGPTGQTGATGVKGDTGTANVIYSAWLDVTTYAPETATSNGVLDTLDFTAVITAPKLTSAILNSGEIKVYFNFGTLAVPDVVPLPYVDIVASGLSITPEFEVGKIDLYSNVKANTATLTDGKHYQYRYILIPGVVNARVAQTVDWNDYNKVKEHFGIKD